MMGIYDPFGVAVLVDGYPECKLNENVHSLCGISLLFPSYRPQHQFRRVGNLSDDVSSKRFENKQFRVFPKKRRAR